MTNNLDFNSTHTRIAITASASGDTTVVTSPAATLIGGTSTGVTIRVVDLWLMASAAVNVKFKSSTAGDRTGLMYFAANGGIVLPFNERGWFTTVAGENLVINLSGAIPVGGVLHYVTVQT